MKAAGDYVVQQVDAEHFILERKTEPWPGRVAYVHSVRDRHGALLGWRLRPLVVMQGSKSKIWPTAAEALASTKLIGLSAAKRATGEAGNKRTVAQSTAS